jgi:hypothetical protein
MPPHFSRMSENGYQPSASNRRLDREARRSWMPTAFPRLGPAPGTAFGVLFAYAKQERTPDALALLMDQLQRTFVLALNGAKIN